ncbi:L-gulonolactone oxidase 3 [Ricinus communis]|uniref:L-gulonolactone oxidase n=1 Tax=Ricinus communis TaxID=3988 RepID=B9RS35_RICCO|nr:L-gulonolactone oxidase 3 [Ricinus communis]EEF45895.1 gulonolactone oxidase, putative [Ricinus communis]|eukprot:XP_002516554.1 L-gulonolactone oxidase 3 [Ricinus communis]
MINLSWCLLCVIYLVHRGPALLAVRAMPPPPPIRCNDAGCILYNSYGAWNDRKECHVLNVTYPATEEELRRAVAYANKNKLKIKVVSKFSHTIPKLACPGSENYANSMLISTLNYNSGIEIDTANLAVTADAGVSLRELIDRVEETGLSLVAAPYWEGVSIGGLISTGAHGSSWWGKGGAVHDHVIGLSLIVPASESEGYAKIIRIGAQDQLLRAAKVSLGMLGVISKVKLSLEPAFKRSITYNFTNDDHIEELFIDHGRKYEFGDVTWYPSRHTAVYRYDYRVPLNASGDGVFDFLGFQPNSIVVSLSTRKAEKALENARNVKGKCLLASTFVGFKKLVANGLKNGLIFTGYPVIGHQGKMQTSGSCIYSPAARIDTSCAWDPRIKGLFFYESTAIFRASQFGDFVRDVKKLRDLNPENFCGVDIYNGFLIRFIKASQAYLGQSEDSVVLDFNYYRSDDPSVPRLNQDIWEEVEQMAFFKYGAKPHWAKNRNSAFLNVQSKYPNYSKFLAAKKQLDPQNMFSSEWSDEIFLGREAAKGDGCALEGQCICSEDRHCSPNKGYFCKPGLVYEEARVCRDSSFSST